MFRTLYVCLLGASLVLAGCGGGSSSDGGGGGAVVYTGPATATASGGGASQSVSGQVQITVSGDTVSVGAAGGPPVASGTLNGDSFSISAPASLFNRQGVSCTGTVVLTGTVSGDNANGNLSGAGTACNGIPVTLSGTFSAQRAG